ncbi:uncharacterized protein FA14DRAFT_91499 [Meira miltonrushii]|uniref:SH3 domain-containing protein n=1 Tax=Meira miltonrushii TaxID=1280837 RepID=A0A316V3P6_9BASI|nr:uncharacterized protein FA14DRAFT_91499 [Meira miltonrushii]PWN31618.1 hypothetical protein FA14DRAFT_91499 [Meira miltonrushii]
MLFTSAIVAIATLIPSISAQSRPAGCISLQGSKQCPAFQDQYINPQNLSGAWPWMAQVSDVTSFDDQFSQYWTDPTRFTRTKINIGLQCNRTGSANVTLQYERTVYCAEFTQISYSAQCNAGTQAKMVCQNTCRQYAASEQAIVANPAICAPTSILTAQHNATRSQTLTKDFTQCTDWNSLATNNSNTCVEGSANEGNCGYGPYTSAQLCQACDPSGNNTISSCCTASNTNLSDCASFGYPGAARVAAAASASSSSSSAAAASDTNGSSAASRYNKSGPDLSGGQLAGVIVGCIVGALLLGALIAFLLFGSPEMEKSAGGPSNAMNMNALGAAGLGAGAAGIGAAGFAAHHHEQEQQQQQQQRPASPTTRPTSQALTSSSGGDKGATVPMVRDQYTGQDIHVGEEVVAIYPYNASLNDELTLEPEQRVTIVRLYDDGWALGRTADGSEGALPLVCVSSTKGDLPGRRGGNGSGTGTGTSDDEGMTSGAEYTSSVDGAVTAEEGGFTSDARSQRSRR